MAIHVSYFIGSEDYQSIVACMQMIIAYFDKKNNSPQKEEKSAISHFGSLIYSYISGTSNNPKENSIPFLNELFNNQENGIAYTLQELQKKGKEIIRDMESDYGLASFFCPRRQARVNARKDEYRTMLNNVYLTITNQLIPLVLHMNVDTIKELEELMEVSSEHLIDKTDNTLIYNTKLMKNDEDKLTLTGEQVLKDPSFLKYNQLKVNDDIIKFCFFSCIGDLRDYGRMDFDYVDLDINFLMFKGIQPFDKSAYEESVKNDITQLKAYIDLDNHIINIKQCTDRLEPLGKCSISIIPKFGICHIYGQRDEQVNKLASVEDIVLVCVKNKLNKFKPTSDQLDYKILYSDEILWDVDIVLRRPICEDKIINVLNIKMTENNAKQFIMCLEAQYSLIDSNKDEQPKLNVQYILDETSFKDVYAQFGPDYHSKHKVLRSFWSYPIDFERLHAIPFHGPDPLNANYGFEEIDLNQKPPAYSECFDKNKQVIPSRKFHLPAVIENPIDMYNDYLLRNPSPAIQGALSVLTEEYEGTNELTTSLKGDKSNQTENSLSDSDLESLSTPSPEPGELKATDSLQLLNKIDEEAEGFNFEEQNANYGRKKLRKLIGGNKYSLIDNPFDIDPSLLNDLNSMKPYEEIEEANANIVVNDDPDDGYPIFDYTDEDKSKTFEYLENDIRNSGCVTDHLSSLVTELEDLVCADNELEKFLLEFVVPPPPILEIEDNQKVDQLLQDYDRVAKSMSLLLVSDARNSLISDYSNSSSISEESTDLSGSNGLSITESTQTDFNRSNSTDSGYESVVQSLSQQMEKAEQREIENDLTSNAAVCLDAKGKPDHQLIVEILYEERMNNNLRKLF